MYIAWSIASGMAFAMSVIQLLLWTRDRSSPSALYASIMCLGASLAALLELALLKSKDPNTAMVLTFWMNNAIFCILIPMIWFVSSHLQNRRRSLLYLITAIWTLCIVINLALPGNLTFLSIDRMVPHVTGWGENWYQAIGQTNPLKYLSELATLLIVFFVADATFHTFRAGERPKAVITGGSILFFIVVAGVHSPLVDAGIIASPFIISLCFVGIAIGLSIEIVDQAVRTLTVEKEAAAREASWHTVRENIQLGIISLSGEGRLLYANPFAAELIGGRKIEEFELTKFLGLTASLKTIANANNEKTGAQLPYQKNISVTDEGGTSRKIRWSLLEIPDGANQTTGYLAILEDVTALEKAAEDLKSSQLLIDRYDRASFLVEIGSSVAHDLNQPLTTIMSNAQAGRRMMARSPIPVQEIQEIFDDIVADDRRASDIIKRMRRLLRQGEIEKEDVNLGEVIHNVMRIMGSELRQLKIETDIDLPEGLPMVHIGVIEIQQVFMNLLGNSLRVMRQNETDKPLIEIKARNSAADRVHVSVSDNGPGIDEETQLRIFEPFYSNHDGLGMGLAISQRIVEMHGGPLECSSRFGQGTEFTFSLPVNSSDAHTS